MSSWTLLFDRDADTLAEYWKQGLQSKAYWESVRLFSDVRATFLAIAPCRTAAVASTRFFETKSAPSNPFVGMATLTEMKRPSLFD